MRSGLAVALALVVTASLLLVSACSARGGSAAVVSSETVTVNLKAQRQTIQGFGSTVRVWSDPHLAGSPNVNVPPSVQDQILTDLYRRIGLTRVRNYLDPGIEAQPGGSFNFSGKLTDDQVAFDKQARQYGLKVFFPAPVYLEDWMQPHDVGAYVNWAINVLQRWRALGLTPAYYSPLNEPQVAKDFPPQWLHDVVVQLGQRLQAEGFKTKLVIPDDENPIDAYRRAVAVLSDPEARKYVGAVAFHIYRIGAPSDWARLRALASKYGLPLWMTEYSSTAYTSYDASFDWAVKMHELLTVGGVNAIDYLWGFFGDWKTTSGAMISIHFDNGAVKSWSRNPIYYFTGQYSKYVRPGYRRVAVTGPAGGVLVSAYRGPRSRVVLVATNPTNQARRIQAKALGGTFAAKVAAVRTTSEAGLRQLQPVRSRPHVLTSVLPPLSVTTFISH